jgi:hypothetical protein
MSDLVSTLLRRPCPGRPHRAQPAGSGASHGRRERPAPRSAVTGLPSLAYRRALEYMASPASLDCRMDSVAAPGWPIAEAEVRRRQAN